MDQPSGYGYGTIYQRSSDNRWVAAVDLPSERGKRKRKVFTAATREVVEARLEEYRLANPATEYLGRRAYLDNAQRQGTHTESEWWALVRQCGRRCYHCGIETDPGLSNRESPTHLEKDHLIPVSRGGSDSIENVVVACRACNMEKGTMTVDEYRAWKAATA